MIRTMTRPVLSLRRQTSIELMSGSADTKLASTSFRGSIDETRRRMLACLLSKVVQSDVVSTSLPAKGIHRVLIIRPNHRLGNTLLLTPLLTEIERIYPGAEIDIISAGNAALDIFKRFDQVRNVFSLPQKVVRHLPTLATLLNHLRKHTYDLVIDPCLRSGSGRTLMMAARAPYKLGFVRDNTHGSISCGIAVPPAPVHIAQLPIYLLRTALGESFDAQSCPSLNIRLTTSELSCGAARTKRLLGSRLDGGLQIGLFCAATGDKAFNEAWWLAVVEQLARTRPDARFIEIVPAHGTSVLNNCFPTYFSTSVRGMASVMAALDFVISADCGVMHLAVASGVSTVGVFKTTDSARYAPYGVGSFAVNAANKTPTEVADIVIASDVLCRLRSPDALTKARTPYPLASEEREFS